MIVVDLIFNEYGCQLQLGICWLGSTRERGPTIGGSSSHLGSLLTDHCSVMTIRIVQANAESDASHYLRGLAPYKFL